MPSLRTKLIRLAHQNPELRADLLPLLEKTAGRAPTLEDPEIALAAINALLRNARVPLKGWPSIDKTEVEVQIPSGFESMWKSLKIEIDWARDSRYANVSWTYTHPRGGSNGVTIGVVMFDGDAQKWGWRDESTNQHGYIW